MNNWTKKEQNFSSLIVYDIMEDEFISYEDILTGQSNVTDEKLEKEPCEPDPCMVKDLTILFQMNETYSKMDNFVEI